MEMKFFLNPASCDQWISRTGPEGRARMSDRTPSSPAEREKTNFDQRPGLQSFFMIERDLCDQLSTVLPLSIQIHTDFFTAQFQRWPQQCDKGAAKRSEMKNRNCWIDACFILWNSSCISWLVLLAHQSSTFSNRACLGFEQAWTLVFYLRRLWKSFVFWGLSTDMVIMWSQAVESWSFRTKQATDGNGQDHV